MSARIENVLESYNWDIDERWDNKVLDYDKNKHNWTEYFFEAVRELKPALPDLTQICLLYTSPSPRDRQKSRMPSSA